MEKINFGAVEEASEKAYTSPGTIDVFTIENVTFEASKNSGTQYMGVTFKRKQDSITDRFFFSEKALPRIKGLITCATGAENKEELSLEQIKAKLLGKQVALKVSARRNDEDGKWYATIPFVGFKHASKIGELAFSDKEEADIAAHKKYRENAAMSNADAPSASSGPVGVKSEGDIF